MTEQEAIRLIELIPQGVRVIAIQDVGHRLCCHCGSVNTLDRNNFWIDCRDCGKLSQIENWGAWG